MPNSESQIEIKSQLDDPIWRIQNLYLIKDKESKVRKLSANRAQKILLDRIISDLRAGRPVEDTVLKYRQGGVSTLFLLLHLDRTMFNENVTTGILADKRENLGYLFEIVRFAHESMPDDLRLKLGSDSKSELTFPETRSKIMVSLEIKSTTLHGLHVSERAYMKKEDVERTIGACTPNAWITNETTANGFTHFRDNWLKLKQGKKPGIFLAWPLQEEYRIPAPGQPDNLPPIERTEDEKKLAIRMKREYGIEMDDRQFRYRRKKQEDLGSLFAQEMAESEDECFLSTGGAFFQNSKISVLINESAAENEKHKPKTGPGWIQWEERQQGHIYVVGADVMNEGTGPDPDWHVMACLCVTCAKTAFRYRSRAGIDEFYRVLHQWGGYYNNALLAPEANAHGKAVILGLREMGYRNLYRQNPKQMRAGSAALLQPKYGFETTPKTKPVMLDRLKLSLEGKSTDSVDEFDTEITWLDTEFLKEALNIVEIDGKIGATSGKHDDMVMAYAIAVQMYFKVKPYSQGFDKSRMMLGDKLESAS